MKQSLGTRGLLGSLLLVFLLFSYSTAAARLLVPKLEEGAVDINGFNPILEVEQEDSLELLGVEECENKDEECLKRRMMAEAHLDYIYTQHHKP